MGLYSSNYTQILDAVYKRNIRLIDEYYGVPHGCVLDPLLWIVYINHLHKYVCNTFVNLKADDTGVTVSGANFEELVGLINTEM